MSIKDKVKGLIFGQAIGDALGLGTEFMDKDDISIYYYPDGLRHYSQIFQDSHRERWRKGDWTDDTDQFLCIVDSFLDKKTIDLKDIANNFFEWYCDNPMGIGELTSKVFSVPNYRLEPESTAELIWDKSGRSSAPNGALMRNSIVAILNYNNLEKALKDTEDICRLTHADPRCVDSCKIMTYILWKELHNDSVSLDHILDLLQVDYRTMSYISKSKDSSLEDLNLSDEQTMGYTLKALSAGIWSYYGSQSFAETLFEIINEGGDADTNGCISGSILGAKYGFSAIQDDLVKGLNRWQLLDDKVDELLKVLKL